MPEYKKGLLFDEYAKVKACHKSALKSVDTAKHLKHFENETIDSDALRFGKIFHTALLEPDLMTDMPIYSDLEWAPKADHPEGLSINEQKQKWKDDKAANDEGWFKNEDEKKAIKLMAQSVLDNPLAKSFLEGDGDAEASFFWKDPRTGLECKTRLDWLRSDDIIVEVKTDADPSPEAFGKKVYNYGYHVGAWFNREGFRAVMERDIKAYVYIVVGKSAPHCTSVYMMNEIDFEMGEIDGVPLMMRYKMIKDGGLNDYNQGEDGRYDVIPLQTPGWEKRRYEYSTTTTNETESESEL